MRKCYGEKEQERLDGTIEAVVKRVFSNLETVENYKYPFVVCEFEPMKIDIIDAENIMEDLLEVLDDEYGDPEAGRTKPTEKMLAAAEELAKVVTSEYKPWQCEFTGSEWRFDKEDVLSILRGYLK